MAALRATSRSARGDANCSTGLLGSTIVGFQTPLDCRNFLETVERRSGRASTGAERDHAINGAGRQCLRVSGVGRVAEPVGRRRRRRSRPAARRVRRQLSWPCGRAARCRRRSARLHQGDHREVPGGRTAARVRPRNSAERFVFVQIAEPSRERLPAYRDLRRRVVDDGRAHQPAVRHAAATVR